MTTDTEPTYSGEFILSEANGRRSRDTVTVKVSQTIHAGDVLGETEVGALSVVAVANAGNVGNAAAGNLSATGDAKLGVWSALFGNATHFGVLDPDGAEIGSGNTGAQFTGAGLSFALTAGTVPAAPDDGFAITVSQGAAVPEYELLNPAATDGAERAAAIAYADVTTDGNNTAQVVVIARDAEVKSAKLGWNGASDTQKAVATERLATRGIVIRS